MTKNIEICKAEEVGAQVLDIRTTAERQAVAAINAAFGLAIPLPANEPGDITELPAAVSAHDRQLLAQTLGKPEPAATLSTTDPLATFVATLTRELYRHLADRQAVYPLADFPAWFPHDDRNLAHLLQAFQSLAPRKISNGSATSDGLPDGSTIAHIVSTPAGITKLIDDNQGWTANRAGWLSTLLNLFTDATYVEIACEKCTAEMVSANISGTREVHIKAKSLSFSQSSYSNYMSDSDLYFDELETCNFVGLGSNPIIKPKRLFLPKFKSGTINVGYSASGTNSATIYMYVGCYGKPTDTITFRSTASSATTQALQKIEVHQGTRQKITFQYSQNDLGNLTAENIVSGIFDKLADNTDGAPITLNLGTYLLGKLSDEQKAIAQNKNYTLA